MMSLDSISVVRLSIYSSLRTSSSSKAGFLSDDPLLVVLSLFSSPLLACLSVFSFFPFLTGALIILLSSLDRIGTSGEIYCVSIFYLELLLKLSSLNLPIPFFAMALRILFPFELVLLLGALSFDSLPADDMISDCLAN